MKFLVDECTGIGVSKKLCELGFDSVSVIECMKGAEDEEIIQKAVAEKRIIVTNDKGFGRLARVYQPSGIVLLRLKDESAENKAKLIAFLVTDYADRLLGNIIVVSEKKIRIHPLLEF